jgi:hypothetical protein
MSKLRLDVDALAVESFDTRAPARGHGTVLGRDSFAVVDVAVGHEAFDAKTGGCGLSDGATWCMDNGCTGDEPCTVSTWTTPDFCRTDRGCVEDAVA